MCISDVNYFDMVWDIPTSGTSLHLFGSSANGFGSYKSDLDMCLIMPEDGNVRYWIIVFI